MNWLHACRWLPVVHSDLGTNCEHCEHRVVYRQSGEESEASFAMDADYSLPVCSGAACSPSMAVSNCRREMNGVLRILFLVGVVLAIGGTVSEAWAQTVPSATISLTGTAYQNRIELELGSTRYYSFTVTPADATVTAASNSTAVTAAISDTASGKLLAVTTSATDPGAGNRLANVTVTVSHPGYTSATVTERFSINQPDASDHQVVLSGDLITAPDLSAFNFGDARRRFFYAIDSASVGGNAEVVSKNGLFTVIAFGDVGNQFRQVRVTPLASDPGIETYTDTIILTVGSNGASTGLIAAQHEFTLTINQTAPPPSTDATLSELIVFLNSGEGLNLTPDFDTAESTYTAIAPRFVSSINVAATTSDDDANVQYAVGTNPASASFTDTNVGILPVGSGDNTLTARVTAEDGITTQDYTITLTVPANTDATLSALRVTPDGGEDLTLTPVFNTAESTYTATAPFGTTRVTVSATATDSSGARVQYAVGANPESTDFNTSGDLLTVADGDNVLTVRVTAEDRSTQRDYTITLTVTVSLLFKIKVFLEGAQ